MPRWVLTDRADDLREIMDDPDCDEQQLFNTYRWFSRLNPILGGWKSIYRRQIRPLLSADHPTSILDLGCGGGDILRLIGRYAAQDGMAVQLTGVDPDERAIAFARSAGYDASLNTTLSFEAVDSAALLERGDRYDIVLSNHVLHHLDANDVARFTQDSERLARQLVIHNDILRDDLAFVLFAPVGAACLGSFIRVDGLRSVRRAWHPDELTRLLPSSWDVASRGLFRIHAVHRTNA